MPETPQKFYLTTPIYYVNARPHIGHAYTTIVADVLARRHRLLGDDTYFLTGTDEHGQKIERSAAAAGIPPQQFADQVSASFEGLWKRMGITNDQFIRTTGDAHKLGVQKLFTTLYEKGFIYLASYTGSYCVSDEAFIDAPVGTPCPDCGRLLEEVTEENFFFKLSAFQAQLIDLIESNTLLITPDSSRNEVLSFLRGNTAGATPCSQTAAPGVAAGFSPRETASDNQGASAPGLLTSATGTPYLPGALKDLSISRSSFTWGIPVPEPAASTAAQKHVIYVWLDALANYMTALGYGAVNQDGSAGDTTLFDKFWPADLHLVGKEITRFHCIYWPAFLLAADLPLPKQITAHGWLLFDNSKMSKSKGNIVRTETILSAFGTLCPPPVSVDADRKGPASAGPQDAPVLKGTGFSPSIQNPTGEGALAPEGAPAEPTPHDRDLFAADVLRYYLLREIPFGQDGSFSFEALITDYNADLANGYGNLVSRTLNMIAKRDGLIPAAKIAAYDPHFMADDVISYSRLMSLSKDFESDLEALSFASALTKAKVMVTLVDGYITQYAPWKLVGSDEPEIQYKAGTILYTAAESIRIITALLYPILPYATARVWFQLGLGDIELAARNGQLKDLQWGGLQPNTKLGPLGPIFPRADKGLAQTMADNEEKLTAQPSNLTSDSQTPTTDPAAGPRTSTIAPPTGPLTVGGSHAHSTGPDGTPSHTEAHASGIFAGQPPAASTESPQITIDDFAKIELRVAAITLAERIPKADKLLRLEVDLGPHGQRQILSGIAEFYTPEELIGRRIVVITNLAPRKMRGLESHGMLLAASDGDHGKPHLATCGDEIPLGSRLK
jgi:methionyl-tRNA synthetase